MTTERFLIARGPRSFLRLALPAFGRVTIGAAPSSDICLAEDGVAPEHAVLFLDHGVSLDVRGVKRELAPGDRTTIASVTLELVHGEEPSAQEHASSLPIMDEHVLELIRQAASVDTPVLVRGDTGTGKNLVAELIHARSARARGPLAIVAGTRLDEVEAVAAKTKGGTIVIDEIGGLDPNVQLLLRHLIERPPEGVRLIFTSNHDLEAEMRKDLYIWLQRMVIVLPALRDRPRDILPLAERFLTGGPTLSDGAKRSLAAHSWPGNVRELLHTIERAVLTSTHELIETEDLHLRSEDAASTNLREELAGFERARIVAALDAHPTQAEAAKALGIPLRTLAYRMEALKIRRSKK